MATAIGPTSVIISKKTSKHNIVLFKKSEIVIYIINIRLSRLFGFRESNRQRKKIHADDLSPTRCNPER